MSSNSNVACCTRPFFPRAGDAIHPVLREVGLGDSETKVSWPLIGELLVDVMCVELELRGPDIESLSVVVGWHLVLEFVEVEACGSVFLHHILDGSQPWWWSSLPSSLFIRQVLGFILMYRDSLTFLSCRFLVVSRISMSFHSISWPSCQACSATADFSNAPSLHAALSSLILVVTILFISMSTWLESSNSHVSGHALVGITQEWLDVETSQFKLNTHYIHQQMPPPAVRRPKPTFRWPLTTPTRALDAPTSWLFKGSSQVDIVDSHSCPDEDCSIAVKTVDIKFPLLKNVWLVYHDLASHNYVRFPTENSVTEKKH